MLNRKDRQERGQAILLMAVALIGMLGFAAVALDGGNIYAEQRRAQSAADNAVIAGAYQYMKGITVTSTISNSALDNAASNDYDNNSTSNWVKFYRPPISGAYVGNSSYMQIVITERVPTALAHLVYQGPFQLTVSAVAYAKKGGPPVDGNAVVALNPTDCETVQVNGNGNLNITGGGIFANSNGTGCSGNNVVVEGSGNGDIIANPSINIVAPLEDAYSGSVSPTPSTSAPAIETDPLSDLSTPVCDVDYRGSNPNPASGTLNPGTYNTLDVNNGTLILNPGIYCLTSDSGQAIDMGPSGVISGTGVIIYLEAGGTQITQGSMYLKAPSTTRNPSCAAIMPWDAPANSVCHYLGMVLFVGRNNTNDIKLTGKGGWDIEGTIYAPNTEVNLDGQEDWSLTGQILANNFSMEGNGNKTVYYDPSVIFVPPPSISLMQ